MGRYSVIAQSLGAEVIGLDLSKAVVKAREITSAAPFIHIVQGNIMDPPFRDECFDAVFSLGVIHHTPDASLAFSKLTRLLKKKGVFALWVYGKRHPLVHFIRTFERSITTRMPHKVLYALCYAAAPIGYVLHGLFYSKNRFLHRLAVLFMAVLPISPERYWRVRVQETFDWFAPRYQSHHKPEEVVGWFKREGYNLINVLPGDDAVKAVRQ